MDPKSPDRPAVRELAGCPASERANLMRPDHAPAAVPVVAYLRCGLLELDDDLDLLLEGELSQLPAPVALLLENRLGRLILHRKRPGPGCGR